jgi:hypothetical protein
MADRATATKGDALIALAVVALGLIGQSEPTAAVDGVQTFEC